MNGISTFYHENMKLVDNIISNISMLIKYVLVYVYSRR